MLREILLESVQFYKKYAENSSAGANIDLWKTRTVNLKQEQSAQEFQKKIKNIYLQGFIDTLILMGPHRLLSLPLPLSLCLSLPLPVSLPPLSTI